MRKLFLWALLASALLSAGNAYASETFSAFGLYKVYSSDNPVILRADGEPYYSNVKNLQCVNISLAARLNDTDLVYLPLGTLTDTNTGLRYMLTPGSLTDNLCEYYTSGLSLRYFEGHKVLWNIFTSPDVTAGSAAIPAMSSLNQTLANDAVVPHLRLSRSDGDIPTVGRLDFCFVKSGDWNSPVVPPVRNVNIYINGSSLNDYPAYTELTGLTKAVRTSIALNMSESSLESVAVEYEKDGAKYIWNFQPSYGAYSGIEWGKLALDSQPLTIRAGASEKIDIKIPARYNLAEYFAQNASGDFLTFGNNSVLGLRADSVSFTQGSASWNGLTLNETKSTLSFTLSALQTGRTTLAITLPGLKTYYREVRVTNSSGRLNLSDSNSSGISLKAAEYYIHARMINGRPHYPSAEFEDMTFILSASGDNLPSEGFFGLSKGTWSEVHPVYLADDTDYYISSSGAGWNTADSSQNTEYPGLNITAEKADGASVWWEFPDDAGMNVASASIRGVFSGNFPSSNPLQDFVPYFEMTHDAANIDRITSINVYFVNPETMARVTPNISDAEIDYWYDWNTYSSDTLPGSGKTIPLNYYASASGNHDGDYHDTIYITYTYNGIDYGWEFEPMDYEFYGYITDFAMPVNSSKTVSVNVDNSSELEAIDFMIWDREIISANPAHFTPAEAFSIDITALKEGTASSALVFTKKDYTSYDKFVQTHALIRVTSSDSEAADLNIGSADLKPEFIAANAHASIVEGTTCYYDTDDSKNLYVNLNRIGYIPSDYAYSNNVLFSQSGTLHVYSDDEEIDTIAMYPSVIGWYYDDEDTEYALLSYGSYAISADATRIEWTASSDVITSGTADVSGLNVRSITEQLQTYAPFVELIREGINASGLQYFFVDSMDNLIPTPSSVENVNVYVTNSLIADIANSDNSGFMPLNIPEIYIGSITFSFKDNGVNYAWIFAPVDNPDARVTDDVMAWNTSSPDLPLIMRVGDTRSLTLTARNLTSPLAVVGNSSLLSLEVLSTSGSSVNVQLTALSAGMTSITLTDGENMTWPREVWIADSAGRVPHLTADIDALAESLSSGASSDLPGNPETTSPDVPGDDKPAFTTGDPVNVLNGLSVWPRFAVPADPSGDAYNLEWQKAYTENRPYGVFMFEDEADLLASRDVMSVFTELSMDLILREPAQVLAVVLPELQVKESGVYTFRIPIENVALPSTKIFIHALQEESYTNESEAQSIENWYSDEGGEIEYIFGDEYVNAAVYLSAGKYAPVISAQATSNDVRLIAGDITSVDVSPDISPDVSGDVSPDVSPDMSPDVSPDVSPDISPDVSPDISPDVKPTSPDITPTSPDNPVPQPGPDSGDTPSPTPGPDSGDTPSPTPRPTPTSDDNREDNPSSGGGGGGTTDPNAEDNSGGGTTPREDSENVMLPVAPTKPTVDVEDDTLITKIISAIQAVNSRVLGSSEVIELPSSSFGTTRSYLTNDELALIPSTESPVLILPIMRVNKAAVYVFGVDITNLRVGASIFLYMMPEYVSNASGFISSATDYDAYMFLDDSGTQVSAVPANRHVNIAVYMEPDVIYAPVITTTASGSNSGGNNSGGNNSGGNSGNNSGGNNSGGNSGNNSGGNNSGGNSDNSGDSGSSSGGGGCSAGSSFAVLPLAVMLFIRRKR